MLENYLVYFALWILLQLFVKVNCQIRPSMRSRHTATFIDNKLYILGGKNLSIEYKEFIYLDFSVKFNTKNLLWHDLSSINTVPPHYNAASAKGGADNNTLFLFGIFGTDQQTMKLVYTFDPQSNTWSIPTTASGINITRKSLLLGIMDYNRKMYLWGGFESINRNDLNDMLILDTINLSWGKGSSVGVPTARFGYGATLLPNKNIIYMGGFGGGALSLNEVYLYDTINDNWSTKTTIGKIPSNRFCFSIVLGLDGQRTILFGGDFSTAENSLYALDLINFEWYIPKISGQIPSSRESHTANVIEKFMVISFGSGYNQSIESDILLLDISNNEEYIWTNDFILSSGPTESSPLPSPSATSSNNSQSDKLSFSTGSVAGAIVGLLFGGILISFGFSLLYKWNKNKQKQKNKLLIPGDENREGMFSLRQENIQSNLIPINNSYNHRQEISQTPSRNESTTNHESIIIPAPVINKSYSHGQEAIPITNNERLSAQNIDDLKNEIKQDVIREVLQNLQNNVQASSSNNSGK